jgi:lipopolysaccharide transport system ATP-binding protein
MGTPAIQVERVGKQYRIGAAINRHRTIRDAIAHRAQSTLTSLRAGLRGDFNRRPPETIWALRDVSFEVEQGETVGIVGSNGAGKSTILKILSRITGPTTGVARIRGRVGSLLEVGTGFHAELTGRENTFLNGAILGMSRSEIDRKFDEIVAFAEVGKFIDTPVKHYSSGMHLRLAFAVAAHLEPEILIIDEVLAVGDASFQRKCLGKMSDVAREGRTVLFVSHNLNAVESLCDRAILLEDGRVRCEGHPHHVITQYHKKSVSSDSDRSWSDPSDAPGNESVRLRRVRARPADGDVGDPITTRVPIVLEFEYLKLTPSVRYGITLHVKTLDGVLAFTTSSEYRSVGIEDGDFPVGLYRQVCRIPGDLLNDEGYQIELMVVDHAGALVFKYSNALVFYVRNPIDEQGSWHTKWSGVVRPPLPWTREYLGSTSEHETGSFRDSESLAHLWA